MIVNKKWMLYLVILVLAVILFFLKRKQADEPGNPGVKKKESSGDC